VAVAGGGLQLGTHDGPAPLGVRADYHFHTRFSYDSRTTTRAILERAQESHLELLCVTDHDTVAGAEELIALSRPPVRVVVGCEFTCEDGSHVIGLHLRNMIFERRPRALMEMIKLQGGLVLLPHLFRRGSGIFRNELRRSATFVREALSLADLVECFNGRDTHDNNERSRRFAAEHGLRAVAGSDAHRPQEIGSVFVEYDRPDPVHGVSKRCVFFPSQEPVSEHPLKRGVMEFYHRHQDRLPSVVHSAYRAARASLKRDLPRHAERHPRLQYELPGMESSHVARL
jgi:predicted metal-dependent phosphoesterase TrpH